MRRWILTCLICMITVPLFAPNNGFISIWEAKSYTYIPQHQKLIIEAIFMVEKPNTKEQADKAYERETALGNMQIRDVMLNEVNRIVGFELFKSEDRLDDSKSIQMFILYQNYYNPKWDYKKAALLWNMGSNYHKANNQQRIKGEMYWNKVKRFL